MAEVPAVRARSIQDILAYVDELAPGRGAEVRGRIPPASLERIDTALPNAWIPVEDDQWVVRGLVDTLGRDEATRCWRTFVRAHVKGPLYRGLIRTATKLFGVNPGTFVWAFAKGFGQTYRNVAKPVVLHRDDHSAKLELREMAPEVMAVEPYLICFRAILLGLIDLGERRGEVTFEVDAGARKASATLTWT